MNERERLMQIVDENPVVLLLRDEAERWVDYLISEGVRIGEEGDTYGTTKRIMEQKQRLACNMGCESV